MHLGSREEESAWQDCQMAPTRISLHLFPQGFFQDPTLPVNVAPPGKAAPAALSGCTVSWPLLGIAQGHHMLTVQPQTRQNIPVSVAIYFKSV